MNATNECNRAGARAITAAASVLALPLVLVFALAGCAATPAQDEGPAWVTLLDGSKPKTLANWHAVGENNWRFEKGVVIADSRVGKDSTFLVSNQSFTDLQIRAEVWVTADTNSGVFFRASDPNSVTIRNAYEMNIFDTYRIPENGTGSVATRCMLGEVRPKAAAKWSTFDITVQGTHIVVLMDGVKTIDCNDSTFASGPVALQYGGGKVKWRKVQVRAL